ncbi:MAG: hypothetical protein OXI77_14410 [Chloroflexota bacterium]|nr:hypothetical protein [Chloroflexota bacterium]MDE2909926.1 hypothetical protein [Chloroflexota bacterium]
MKSMILLFLLTTMLVLPVLGHDGEAVINEDPYTVVDCGAVLGKITVGNNDPAPLYSTLLHAILGANMEAWDSQWRTMALLYAAATVECENKETVGDEPQQADEDEAKVLEEEDAVLEFSSKEHGQEPLLGPMTLPAGIYIVTLNAIGLASAEFEAISECDGDMEYGMYIYDNEGKVQERLDIETDCRFTIVVDADDDWTLSIQLL